MVQMGLGRSWAMLLESKLFSVSPLLSESWPFFFMLSFSVDNLHAQDHIHLLAKLRSRLLKPSNLLVLGCETACRAHVQQVFETFPKERHNLTQRSIDNKDKQNYSSIPILVSEDVQTCLKELTPTDNNTGTIVYLDMMRRIRDSIFDKSLSPIKRIELIWRVVFFCRIWRKWMSKTTYPEQDHFITPNVYSCLEINAHMILCLVVSVFNGNLPKECLRVWTTGSQACQQTFRLLRSMSSNFSTMVNFTLKGILGRINKLNYVASIECTEEIVFPRTKKRLLQMNEESEDTLSVLQSSEEIQKCILTAKLSAIEDAKQCSMSLDDYDDRNLIIDSVNELLNDDDDDDEDDDSNGNDAVNTSENITNISDEVALLIQEDSTQIRLSKDLQNGMPTYTTTTDKGTQKNKTYQLSQFVEYQGGIHTEIDCTVPIARKPCTFQRSTNSCKGKQ